MASQLKEATRIAPATAFSACDMDLLWQQALGLLAVMRQTCILPGADSYSAMISACENDQHWQQAWGLLERMQQTRVLLDVMSCSTVSSTYHSLSGSSSRGSTVWVAATELQEKMFTVSCM